MANELLLTGGLIVTVDNSLGDLPDADVLIRDGVIVAVAPGLSSSTERTRRLLTAEDALLFQDWSIRGRRISTTVTSACLPGVRHLDGYGDPVATMVLGAGPADVETVIVGGDVMKRDYKLVGAHVSKARKLMTESRERLHARETAAGREAPRV